MAPRNKTQPKPEAPKPEAPVKQVNPPPASTPGPEAQASSLAPLKPSSVALMTAAPDWLKSEMKGREAQGLEKANSNDIIIPRLVLAQSEHPEVKDGLIKVGSIFDNLTKQVLAEPGTELEVIPVVLAKSRIMFHPMDAGGGIDCRSDDSLTARPNGQGKDAGDQPTDDCLKCVLKEWDDTAEGNDSKPGCTMFYNFAVMLPAFGYVLYMLSMKSTQVKVARRFLSTAKQTGADFFAQKYAFKAVAANSGQFKFQQWDFRVVGWVDQSEYAHGKWIFDSFKGKVVQADVSDLETRDNAAAPPPKDAEFPPEPEPTKISPEAMAQAAERRAANATATATASGPKSPEPPPPAGEDAF